MEKKINTPLGHTKILVVCEMCGEQVEIYRCSSRSYKFCSSKCYNNFRKQSGIITISCDNCGKNFTLKKVYFERSKKNFCSKKCYLESCVASIKRSGASWRRLKKAIKRDLGICLQCGKQAECVHHIIPLRDFTSTKKSDVLSNLISLCKKCHQETYSNEYKYVPIFKGILKERYGYYG
jgi:endogenous inhibitor of DNA gyrase (YacG/DUF329 family)